MKRFWVLAGVIFAVVAGCTTNIDIQQKHSFLRDQATKDPTCSNANDCAEKWERASQWVNANSYWRVKKMSDTRIETRKARAYHYTRTTYLVKKLPRSDGSSVIRLQASCFPSVHCVPNTVIAIGSFNHFVNTGKELHLPNG